jgi:hypothetical protein
MNDDKSNETFVFPRWLNILRYAIALAAVGGAAYAGVVVTFGFSPETTDVGYAPLQPVAYSHALHAAELGIDCRYCHNTVEVAAEAAIPPASTCMNCHATVRTSSPQLTAVRASAATGEPLAWLRVHDLPDYVYFDHSVHLAAGVGCVSCHGRVDTMEVVQQVEPLSMGWCLDCHRQPERHLRPFESLTEMDWLPEEDRLALGSRLREERQLEPPEDCAACHR